MSELETLQDACAIALAQDPEIQASRWQSSPAQRGYRAALLQKRMNVESAISLQVKQVRHELDTAQQQVVINRSKLEIADANLRVSRERYVEGEGHGSSGRSDSSHLDLQELLPQCVRFRVG